MRLPCEDTPFIVEFLYLTSKYRSIEHIEYNYRRMREGQITYGFTEKRLDMFKNIEFLMTKYQGTDFIIYLQTLYIYWAKSYYFETYILSSDIKGKAQEMIAPVVEYAKSLKFLSHSLSQKLQWKFFLMAPSLYAFLVVHIMPLVRKALGK